MIYVAEGMEKLNIPEYTIVAKYIRICFGRDVRLDELTKSRILEFRDFLMRHMRPATVKMKLGLLKAFCNRYSEEEPIPCKDKRVFYVKPDVVVNTYLEKWELDMLEKSLPVQTPQCRYYAVKFLVGAYTGCRQSDILHITPAHIHNGMLTYIAEKNGKKITVPITAKTVNWIYYIQEHYDEFDGALTPNSQRAIYNRRLREACRAAFINTPVMTVRAGKEKTTPKYEAVTTHTARRSFATNLYLAGMDPWQIAKLIGHTSPELTMKCYICAERTAMPTEALAYFNG